MACGATVDAQPMNFCSPASFSNCTRNPLDARTRGGRELSPAAPAGC